MQAMAVAAPVMQGASAIFGGLAEQSVKEQQAQQAANSAVASRTAASQTGTQIAEELRGNLANITALRAASGVVPYSPTGVAVLEDARQKSDREGAIRIGNLRRQAAQYESDAGIMAYAGQAALIGGIFKSLPAFASAGQKVMR